MWLWLEPFQENLPTHNLTFLHLIRELSTLSQPASRCCVSTNGVFFSCTLSTACIPFRYTTTSSFYFASSLSHTRPTRPNPPRLSSPWLQVYSPQQVLCTIMWIDREHCLLFTRKAGRRWFTEHGESFLLQPWFSAFRHFVDLKVHAATVTVYLKVTYNAVPPITIIGPDQAAQAFVYLSP